MGARDFTFVSEKVSSTVLCKLHKRANILLISCFTLKNKLHDLLINNNLQSSLFNTLWFAAASRTFGDISPRVYTLFVDKMHAQIHSECIHTYTCVCGMIHLKVKAKFPPHCHPSTAPLPCFTNGTQFCLASCL